MFRPFVLLPALVLLLPSFLFAVHEDVSLGERPGWVEVQEWDATVVTPSLGSGNESVVYLLTDSQHRPQKEESYRKRVYRVTNDTGVQQKLKVTIDFDPAYSKLIIHDISIRRGNETVDKLDLEKMKVFQPEDDLSRDVYDEDKRCLVFLDDLRVDDIVVVEYTIVGRNPALLSHYSFRLPIQFYVPVERSFHRLVWDYETPVSYLARYSDIQPEIRKLEDRVEYSWSIPPQAASEHEDLTPVDFDETPYLEISSTSEWADVVAWGLETYKVLDEPLDPETLKILDEWKQETTEKEELALRALRFVQDKIRYVGMTMGSRGLLPAAPSKTMECRFGDCKGKAGLLCAMLRSMDIEASPALVNTYRRSHIDDSLPTPLAFNHVIVKAKLGGNTIWVDPTFSQQGGKFSESYVPPYGKALVLRKGSEKLETVRVPAKAMDQEHVVVNFDVDDYDAPATMKVRTTYSGRAADSMRRSLVDSNYETMANDYLNYYAKTYPGIRDPAPLEITDDIVGNTLRIVEKYTVGDLFVGDEDQPRQVELYPFGLGRVLPYPETRIRKTPLAISYPARRTYKTILRTPDPLDYDDYVEEVNSPAFKFSTRQRFKGNTSEFEYSIETLQDRVAASDVAEYLSKYEELNDLLGDYPEEPMPVDNRINWLAIFLVLLSVAVVGVMAFLLLRAARFRGTGMAEPGYESIGGWLILVGIGVILAPFLAPINLVIGGSTYFTWASWSDLDYGLVLAFEVVANSAATVLALVLAWSFIKKRKLFPGLFIFYSVMMILIVVLDNALCEMLLDDPVVAKDYALLAKMTIRAMVWCPYMLISKRVKGTFVY